MIGHYNHKVNRISFEQENYEDRQELFDDVAKVMEILVRNGEICTFFNEEGGTYILQHNYDNAEYGCEIPKWITQDDWEDYKFWEEEVKVNPDELPFSDVEVGEEYGEE